MAKGKGKKMALRSAASRNDNETNEAQMGTGTGFSLINEDLLQTLLSRLPAASFASAACVSKTWNRVCNRILSRPKLASAVSSDPSHTVALQQVLDKVLHDPIRPHFAIATVSMGFDLEQSLQFMVEKLGSRTPIILSSANGVIGRDAVTDDFREVKWDAAYSDIDEEAFARSGIVLTVGFVPGLKVDAIPLLKQRKAFQEAAVDRFVKDIRNYSATVSGCTSPRAIILFGDGQVDQKPLVETLDSVMPKETIIVGDERAQFLYRSVDNLTNANGNGRCFPGAVALVFATDRDKAHDIGDIQFHMSLSTGVSPIGPRYKAVSVRVNSSNILTMLTARREGQQVTLDGQRILDHINVELGNQIECPDIYIGVTKRRNFSIGLEKPRLMTSLAFHAVIGGDEEQLYVEGVGMRTGDYFQFYRSDPEAAAASCSNVSATLKNLKAGWGSKTCTGSRGVANSMEKKEAFGGLIFSCCGRGKSFFGCLNVDSSPFLENFPGIPVGGIFCGGEIGRGYSSLMAVGGQEEGSAQSGLHVYSTVYLLMSYNPAPAEH